MNDKPIKRGKVVERLPNLQYRVQNSENKIIRAFASGKMKINKIIILVGDEVEYEVDRYGDNNRIIRRL